jgi:hypothetical protein
MNNGIAIQRIARGLKLFPAYPYISKLQKMLDRCLSG